MSDEAGLGGSRASLDEAIVADLISRAEHGDTEAAREVLSEITNDLLRNQLRPPLRTYLIEKLVCFLDQDMPLLDVLGLSSSGKPTGPPKKYIDEELMAVDLLLRDHLGLKKEAAIIWIEENIGADRRHVQRLRKVFDSRGASESSHPLMEALSMDDLLHLAGSMRNKVGVLIPHT